MHVLLPRAALLANTEVLALLRDQDTRHRARAKSAARRPATDPHPDDVPENLRTVELEAIQYLSAEYQPTPRLSDHALTQLVRDLAPFRLTKAEKLQVVNLAPTEPVELYVIVEELEDRLGDRMDDILRLVSQSLSAAPPSTPPQSTVPTTVETCDVEQAWEHDAEDPEFDDLGDGAGVQGDLDMEDDD